MKVTVTFGQTGVVVPCKEGWTVRELIQQATQRYRKLLEQVSPDAFPAAWGGDPPEVTPSVCASTFEFGPGEIRRSGVSETLTPRFRFMFLNWEKSGRKFRAGSVRLSPPPPGAAQNVDKSAGGKKKNHFGFFPRPG